MHAMNAEVPQYNSLIFGLDSVFHLVRTLSFARVDALAFSVAIMKPLIERLAKQKVALTIADAFRYKEL